MHNLNTESVTAVTVRSRVLGGLWGAVVGDALGVSREFQSRESLRHHPVTGMEGFGTHNQPPGTWSDDSSLLLCKVDSLLAHPFDPEDIGRRFVSWSKGELWTPWGRVFDIGIATRQALSRIARGVPAEQAGGVDEGSNGNGSLMRILPIALRFANDPPERLIEYAHRASAITHRHPRSQMVCGLYCLVVAGVLRGETPAQAHYAAEKIFRAMHQEQPLAAELPHFATALAKDLAVVPDRAIKSGGYVLDTLSASIWCLLTTTSYRECVLKAVNLGGDTDTTGCVAGGLAGVAYGLDAVPQDWRAAMARTADLEALFARFVSLLPVSPAPYPPPTAPTEV